jgi:hypothetical protein
MNLPYILTSAICLLIVACASFPREDFPKYTFDQLYPPETKLSVNYDVTYRVAPFTGLTDITGKPSNMYQFHDPNMISIATEFVTKEVEAALSESGLFAVINSEGGENDFHFIFDFRNEGYFPMGMWGPVLTGATLTIIPTYVRDHLILTIDVNKGDQLLKQYRYWHYLDTWFQFFLIFQFFDHSPNNASKEVVHDMLMAFFYDLQKDEFLLRQPEGFD